MKITKMGIDPEHIAKLRELEKIAKLDCDKCPCCGEAKSFDEYFDENIIDKGIIESSGRELIGKWNNRKLYETTYYRCKTCGAMWESEPYEVLREW